MIHMNVYLLKDAYIMAIYGIIFSQKQFYGIVGMDTLMSPRTMV